MVEFSPTAIDSLLREAYYGSAIGCTGVFIWWNFYLYHIPPSAIDNSVLISVIILQGILSHPKKLGKNKIYNVFVARCRYIICLRLRAI